MAGAFAPSPELRGLAWGIDGIGIIVACAVLVVDHLQRGDGHLAAGFLVFLVGETVVTSAAAAPLDASAPSLAAGSGLWAAGLALVSLSSAIPLFVRATGAIAAVLLGGVLGATLLGQPRLDVLVLALALGAPLSSRHGYLPVGFRVPYPRTP